MIADLLSNSHLYNKISARIAKGFEYLKNTDFATVSPGKYEIDGTNIFASIAEYNTKDISEGKYEAHKQYIDIQYIVKGEERLYFTPISETSELIAYNSEKDVEFVTAEGGNYIVAPAGTFLIFFPNDAHMPNITNNAQSAVKKVVVKVKVD